uniref:Uncharacterized protein n=1 Tax=Rhizophora mucronata TaxID=61149 RepID=A0A2P2L9A0_RHIMU
MFHYIPLYVLLFTLQFAGVDPLQAGNVVQLVMVLGLTVGWISTYIFRVSNKEMTYAQQLHDYEKKVMEVRHIKILFLVYQNHFFLFAKTLCVRHYIMPFTETEVCFYGAFLSTSIRMAAN